MRLLIVVGCRLGDEHILRSVKDGLAANRGLRVLVVDPVSANQIADRIAGRKSLPDVKMRTEALPVDIEKALSGLLFHCIEKALRGEPSIHSRLRISIRNLPADWAVCECTNAAKLLSSPRPLEPTDNELIGAVIESEVRRYRTEGSRRALYSALENAIAQPEWKEQLARCLFQAKGECGEKLFSSSAGIAQRDGTVFVIGGTPQRVHTLDEDWTARPLGPSLKDAYGLDIVGDEAIVIERTRLGLNGLGALSAISLTTGKRRRVLPPPPTSSALVKTLFHTVRASAREKPAIQHQELKGHLLDLGFLDWPTSVRALGGSRVLVVESKCASVVDILSSAVERRVSGDFINLADCAIYKDDRVLLLEGGMRGRGRVLIWNLADETVDCIAKNVRNFAGIAVDSRTGSVLVTVGDEGPNGRVLKYSVVGGLLRLEAVLADALHVPRYLCQVGEFWYCSTGHGPVRFRF